MPFDCDCCCWDCCRCDDDYNYVEELVHDWSYVPSRLRFMGTDPNGLYLGAEFELDTSSSDIAFQAAREAYDCVGDMAYLKEDGSLQYGFEVVTVPMSYNYFMDCFPFHIFPHLREIGMEASSHAGIHVHVSRAGFSGPLHIYRWLKLWFRNSLYVTNIARRNSRQWAAFDDRQRRLQKSYCKGGGDGSINRYAAINMSNEDTFEVRVFRSSTRPQRLRASVQLVHASVEYARGITCANILKDGAWDWSRFMRYVVDNRETYTDLVRECAERFCAVKDARETVTVSALETYIEYIWNISPRTGVRKPTILRNHDELSRIVLGY